MSWMDMSHTGLEGNLNEVANVLAENDTTAYTPCQLGEDLHLDPEHEKSQSNTIFNDVEYRRLSWVLMEEISDGLEEFTSLREFVTVFGGAILAHKSLHAVKMLHRDINLRNVMINKKALHSDSDNIRQGHLIDLDYAVKHPLSQNIQARRPGTLPFMAVEILMDKTAKHRAVHDLESFFYVFLWACTVLAGPNDTWRGGDFRAHQCFLRLWMTGPNYQEIGRSKRAQMATDYRLLLDSIHPYFHDLQLTVVKWMGLMFSNAPRIPKSEDFLREEGERNKKDNERQDETAAFEAFTHDDVINVLEECLRTLPATDPEMPPDGWNDKLTSTPAR